MHFHFCIRFIYFIYHHVKKHFNTSAFLRTKQISCLSTPLSAFLLFLHFSLIHSNSSFFLSSLHFSLLCSCFVLTRTLIFQLFLYFVFFLVLVCNFSSSIICCTYPPLACRVSYFSRKFC